MADLAPAAGSGTPLAAEFPANTRVEHRVWGAGVVMRTEADRLTVRFERAGYRTLAAAAVADGILAAVRARGRSPGRRSRS